MSQPSRPPLPNHARLYEAVVMVIGFTVVGLSAASLLRDRPSSDFGWLAVLTLLSGFLPVKLPKVSANISVSETFVFCGTLLFGPAAGTILVFLDVALVWARLAKTGVLWHRMLFSMAANPLSIWIAAIVLFEVAATAPLSLLPVSEPTVRLIGGLVSFTVVYFILNSSLLAIAIGLEQRLNPLEIWSKHFSRLWLNYWAGAAVAALLVSITHKISVLVLFLIAPLMLVLFFTYKWSMERVEKAEKHLTELKGTFLRTIEALALAIDAKDQVTHGHIRRVQRYTMALAEALGVTDENQLDALRAAALLHDTGKLAVPEYILNKPGPLTSSEFERMKVHADVGADILKSINFPYPVEPIVRHHHEAWNGSGYPAGLKAQEIPLGARILSVVDCYDALTSDRPYRPRMSRQQAEQELRDRRGRVYDPWVVDQFFKILDSLEQAEIAEQNKSTSGMPASAAPLATNQLDVISATTAEDREFNELRRDLPRAVSLGDAADILFRHLRRVIPASSWALYLPKSDSNEIGVVASSGVAASVMDSLRVPIGERISGWAFAHAQAVLNSDAALELGPVAKSFSVPLRYAAAVPVLDGKVVAVILAFSGEPFEKDHRRLLENAATLFASSVPESLGNGSDQAKSARHAGSQKPHIH